jgi:hypothetical protein
MKYANGHGLLVCVHFMLRRSFSVCNMGKGNANEAENTQGCEWYSTQTLNVLPEFDLATRMSECGT